MTPKALLWDNDGVLVDTEPLFFRATRDVLAPFGVTVTEEMYVDYALRRGRSLLELIAEKGVAREEIDRTREVRQLHHHHHRANAHFPSCAIDVAGPPGGRGCEPKLDAEDEKRGGAATSLPAARAPPPA